MKSFLIAAGLLSVCSVLSVADAAAQAATPLEKILSHNHECSASLSLRTQAFTPEQENATCLRLAQVERRFHQLFAVHGQNLAPVRHDGNTSLRANIYASRADFEKYATGHFAMPIDNGGMYLEGLPDQPGNHAEFVANQRKDGQVHNLEHEFVHYLDGRFNLYGDFCATPHDSHGPPENCPHPAPLTPYLVWWGEGVAEYIAKGNTYPEALASSSKQAFTLSQLFDTGYESNAGVERTYHWGYLAVRYMFEQQRPKLDQMLHLTRQGDYPRYQALVKSWGSSMDEDFARWLKPLQAEHARLAQKTAPKQAATVKESAKPAPG